MAIRTIISFICSFFSVWQKWKFVIIAIIPIVISVVCPSGAVLCASQEAGLCGLDLLDTLCLVSAWLEQWGAAAHQSAACSQSSRVLCLSVCLPLTLCPSFSLCVFVYVCTGVCHDICLEVRRPLSVYFTLFKTGYLLCFWHTRVGGPRASGASVSTSHLAIGTLGLQMHIPACRLSWVLEV